MAKAVLEVLVVRGVPVLGRSACGTFAGLERVESLRWLQYLAHSTADGNSRRKQRGRPEGGVEV